MLVTYTIKIKGCVIFLKAYIVEDLYRNNQVLVYALDAEGARTAAKNTKELAHVEWIDLQVRHTEHADHKDHLIEKRGLTDG